MQRALQGRGEVVEVRRPSQMAQCDGLVLPGGESTTICRQLESSGMAQELKRAAGSGVSILATCAGLVLVSKESRARERSGRWGSWISR